MYNLSAEFNEFYKTCVVLPASVQNDLRQKKNLNIKRLKDGLEEYNSEHGTNYKISEERVQGSMAMHTVTTLMLQSYLKKMHLMEWVHRQQETL